MQPVLKTERLTLRPLDISDVDTVHIYASDPELTRYMIHLPNDTREETMHFLKMVTAEWQKNMPESYEFAVVLEEKQIGAVSISLNDDRTEGELGWIFNKNYQGKGYAAEAALAVKEFALKDLKVRKLTAHCDYRNQPSFRLMEKIGLTLSNDTGTRTYSRTQETVKELTYSLEVN